MSVFTLIRYILAFSFVFLLALIVWGAAIAADAPALGQLALVVALGLFVASLASAVTERRRPQRTKTPVVR